MSGFPPPSPPQRTHIRVTLTPGMICGGGGGHLLFPVQVQGMFFPKRPRRKRRKQQKEKKHETKSYEVKHVVLVMTMMMVVAITVLDDAGSWNVSGFVGYLSCARQIHSLYLPLTFLPAAVRRFLHGSQNHFAFPLGATFNPTHSRWNHSRSHVSASHATISP